jgi:hypothetical protein
MGFLLVVERDWNLPQKYPHVRRKSFWLQDWTLGATPAGCLQATSNAGENPGGQSGKALRLFDAAA